MGKFTQISESTFSELQLNAGVLLKEFDPEAGTLTNANIICATSGGINATLTPTYSDLGADVDNCPVNMLELKNLDSWEAKLSFTALSITADMLKMSIGAADISDTKVTPRRDLDATKDYQTVWWVGDLSDGGFVAIKLMNALSTGGFGLQTTKSGKGTLSVELTGHVSIKAQTVVPMEFYVKGAD